MSAACPGPLACPFVKRRCRRLAVGLATRTMATGGLRPVPRRARTRPSRPGRGRGPPPRRNTRRLQPVPRRARTSTCRTSARGRLLEVAPEPRTTCAYLPPKSNAPLYIRLATPAFEPVKTATKPAQVRGARSGRSANKPACLRSSAPPKDTSRYTSCGRRTSTTTTTTTRTTATRPLTAPRADSMADPWCSDAAEARQGRRRGADRGRIGAS